MGAYSALQFGVAVFYASLACAPLNQHVEDRWRVVCAVVAGSFVFLGLVST